MSQLLPGTQVLARGLPWTIVDTEPAGTQQRFRLRCTSGDLTGQEFDFLYPFESITPIVTALDPSRPGRLDAWKLYHHAFLLEQALGPDALLAAQPGRLDIAPYQLVPVMRALQAGRPRLLLADGVGLGKTIQAGMIMVELIARRRAHRILIVSPAGPLLKQWQQELRTRFGLRFETVSSGGELAELKRGLLLGTNPFDHLSFCLLSIDFAKQEKVLADLERSSWDLVVIDEAHHCVRMSGAGEWEDTRRRRLAEVLARQSDGLLLLTATPHDGYDAHFASLLELLDPSLLDGRGSLRGERYRAHVIRRLKDHLKDPKTDEPLFQKRIVDPRPVPFGPQSHPLFSALQRGILALVAPRLKAALRHKQFGEVLAFVSLLKRSVSTVSACRNTLAVILERYTELLKGGQEQAEQRQQRLKTLRDYRRRLEQYGTLSFDEEQDQATLEAEDMAAELLLHDDTHDNHSLIEQISSLEKETRRTRRQRQQTSATGQALEALLQLADDAKPEDPKLATLVETLRAIRTEHPRANVLVYTEYAHSQAVVREAIQLAIDNRSLTGEVVAISGEDPDAAREVATNRFCSSDNLILVSTDATAEGLNLHARCHHLIHLELPYNPNRLEQRNGRIDRYGQTKPPHVTYIYLQGTFEERLLLALIAKYERQRARLTFVPNTLGGLTSDQASTTRLLEGLATEEEQLFQTAQRPISFDPSAEQEELSSPAYQALLTEVEHAIQHIEKASRTHRWFVEKGLNAEAALIDGALKARNAGQRLGAVELLPFVCEAVEHEVNGVDAVTRHPDGTVELRIPPRWLPGLTDVEGLDASRQRLLLTDNPKLYQDSRGRAVGFIGRAHPIVRRALDRVRNLRFGETGSWSDQRVAILSAPVPEPTALLTFLCALTSSRGHEYERVIAVELTRSGACRAMTEPSEWQTLLETPGDRPPGNVWQEHFAAWLELRQELARSTADAHFQTLAGEVRLHLQRQIDGELEALHQWVNTRAQELCKALELAQLQINIFAAPLEQSPLPVWRRPGLPLARLASFAKDGSNRAGERQEAESVLHLHRQRHEALLAQRELKLEPPSPLGMLLLLPVTAGGR